MPDTRYACPMPPCGEVFDCTFLTLLSLMTAPSLRLLPEHGGTAGTLAEQQRFLPAGRECEGNALQHRELVAAAAAVFAVLSPAEQLLPGDGVEQTLPAAGLVEEVTHPAPAHVLWHANAHAAAGADDGVTGRIALNIDGAELV